MFKYLRLGHILSKHFVFEKDTETNQIRLIFNTDKLGLTQSLILSEHDRIKLKKWINKEIKKTKNILLER